MTTNSDDHVEVTFTGNVALSIPEEIKPITIKGIDIENQIWALAGAPDDSKITVKRYITQDNKFVLKFTVKNKILDSPMIRQILVKTDDATNEIVSLIVLENVDFCLKPKYRGHGIGKISLQLEAMAATNIGITKIQANVAGSSTDSKYTGYKVWPKLGYDALIDQDIFDKMPKSDIYAAGLSQPLRISDLLDNNLYHLWENFGAGCTMELDTSSVSTKSMKRLFK